MKPCATCERLNQDEALFCHQCGAPFTVASYPVPTDEPDLWKAFIGSSKTIVFSLKDWWTWERADEHYLRIFRKFSAGTTPRFALTWNWAAFLFDPFLWFLYRKMYLYAGIYAVGPVVSAYFTGDLSVGIVWRMMAGASANYIYYWHVKEQLARIQAKPNLDVGQRVKEIHEEGGVQPYVIWVGVILHIMVLAMLIMMITQGPPEGMKGTGMKALPSLDRTT
jgi:hypothetical protein